MENANRIYPNINMEKTGLLLREKVSEQGYTVKDVQKYLKKQKEETINTAFADALSGIKLQ